MSYENRNLKIDLIKFEISDVYPQNKGKQWSWIKIFMDEKSQGPVKLVRRGNNLDNKCVMEFLLQVMKLFKAHRHPQKTNS